MIKKPVLVEYIWLDANNNFRSKVKATTDFKIVVNETEIWNFDGSSTNQATGNDSEIFLKPYKIFNGGLKKNHDYYYVFCECLNPNGTPHKTNTRKEVVDFFNKQEIKDLDTIFGIEQEFFVFKNDVPLIWNAEMTKLQGNYYCGNGSSNVNQGREFLDKVTEVLIEWGINVTGYNFEVAPGQMEIQICEKGIEAADNLIALRFILTRLAEERGWDIILTPKPDILNSDKWNGSGCHVNFSTKQIRTIDTNDCYSSLNITSKLINTMRKYHVKDIDSFGSENNKLRLGGKNEASSYNTFNYGVANRGCSIRIPRAFVNQLSGYIEDRRPGADMDPYIVTKTITSYVIDLQETPEDTEEIKKISSSILDKHNNEKMV
jgi:glutamine synthetase